VGGLSFETTKIKKEAISLEKRRAKKLPKFITNDQAQSMLDEIGTRTKQDIRDYAIIIMILRSGLRVQEVCNLTPADVDLESGIIYVQIGKEEKDRYTCMDDEALEAARKWAKHRLESKFFFHTLKVGKTGAVGQQMNQRFIRKLCENLSKKAGVFIQDGQEQKPVSPHKLRHSFATRALNDVGMNIRELQEMLGHADLSSTMIYTHVNPKELAEKYKSRSKGLSVPK
jgi:integrase/recombinase XerD